MAIDLVSREAWRARPPRGSYSTLTATKGVKIHYTGGRVEPATLADHARCVAMVRSIQSHHMDGNGWMDIGYSMVACPHRKVFTGRGPGRLPAANGAGLNSGHYAVLALVGNAGLTEPGDDLLHAVLDAVGHLREHGGAGREIKGHRDGYATDCPGDALYAWVKKGARRPGGPPPTGPAPHPPFPGRPLAYPPVMRGEDVRTWQAQMRKRGRVLDADGAYGAESREVCRKFQREQNLDVDGIVGRLTWDASWKAPLA